MKWILLFVAVLCLQGCCFTSALLCNQYNSATRVEPVMVYPYSNGPIDVTTTTIDFY